MKDTELKNNKLVRTMFQRLAEKLGMNSDKELNILPSNSSHQQEFNLTTPKPIEGLGDNDSFSSYCPTSAKSKGLFTPNEKDLKNWTHEGDTKVVKTATLKISDIVKGRPENAFSQSEIAHFLNCSPSVVVRLAIQNGWRKIDWTSYNHLPNRVWYKVTQSHVESCFNGSELGFSTNQIIDMLELDHKSSSNTLISKLAKFSNWDKNPNSAHSYYSITEEQAKKDFYNYSTEIGSVNVLNNRILISHRPRECYYKTEISTYIRKHSKYAKSLKKHISLQVILALAKDFNWKYRKVSENSKYNYHFEINLRQASLDYDVYKMNSYKKRGDKAQAMNKIGAEESRLIEEGFVRLSYIRDEFFSHLNFRTHSIARSLILSVASFSKWEKADVPFNGGQGFVALYKITKNQALDDLKAFEAQKYEVPVTICGNHENIFSKDYKWFNENDGKLMENYVLEEFDGYMCTFSHEGQNGIKVPCNFFSERNQLDLPSDNY